MNQSTIQHAKAVIKLEPTDRGTRHLTIIAKDAKTYIHRSECVTDYTDNVIRDILAAKGPAYLCDEIAREQDPYYIRQHVELTVTAYVDPKKLIGKRLLDFGCGAGASTVILAKLLPQTEIVGVELDQLNLKAAKARVAFHGLKNVTLHQSPSGDKLPSDLGSFDAVMLSAVYEHLLPNERKTLLPLLWTHLKTGGVMFLDETPWRWFPVETHTTGLPFINYLPDGLALRYARICSRRIAKNATWVQLLRAGIRGGTARGIQHDIGEGAVLIKPKRNGINNQASLWRAGYASNNISADGWSKKTYGLFASAVCSLTRTAPIPYLSLALHKPKR